MRFLLCISLLASACSAMPEKPADSEPRDYRSVDSDDSDEAGVEPTPPTKPSCDGLEGAFLEKCRRALAVLRVICPEGELVAEGCKMCPGFDGLDEGPAPYAFRNNAAARDKNGEASERQILLMEGCREDGLQTVLLAEPGDHERPWIVRAVEPALGTDLSKYRFEERCGQDSEKISTAQCEMSLYLAGDAASKPSVTPVGPVSKTASKPDDTQRRTIMSAHRQLSFCYENQLGRQPQLRGYIAFELKLEPSGKVARVRVTADEIGSPVVKKCMVAQLGRLTFPESEEGAIIEIGFRFEPG